MYPGGPGTRHYTYSRLMSWTVLLKTELFKKNTWYPCSWKPVNKRRKDKKIHCFRYNRNQGARNDMECFNISNRLKRKRGTHALYQKKLSHLKYDQDLLFNSYLGIQDKLVSRSPWFLCCHSFLVFYCSCSS